MGISGDVAVRLLRGSGKEKRFCEKGREQLLRRVSLGETQRVGKAAWSANSSGKGNDD